MPRITPDEMSAFRAELTRNRSLVDGIKMMIAGFTAQAEAAAGPDQSDELRAVLAEWKARDNEMAAAVVAGTPAAAAAAVPGAGPVLIPPEPQVGDPLPHNELSGGNPVGQQDGTEAAPAGQPAPIGSDLPIGAGTAGGEAAAQETVHGSAGTGPAAGRVTLQGSIADDILTLEANPFAPLSAGTLIEGTGIAPETRIEAEGPGGTYVVSPAGQTVPTTAITATFSGPAAAGGTISFSGSIAGDVLTLADSPGIALRAGMLIEGDGVVSGTSVQGEGPGGTYIVHPAQTVAATAMTAVPPPD
jgi:hypothetical protein